MRTRWVLSVSLLLAACGTTGDLPPAPVVTVCQSSAVTAPLEAQPRAPVLTADQQLAMDAGAIRAVGPDLAAEVTRWQDVTLMAWARRGWARVAEAQAGC